MDKKFRIVFQGSLRKDLDPAVVRQQAAARLKATPMQIERIFSGARVVLKQNLGAAQAQAYQDALAQLGMLVRLEDSPVAPAPQAAAPTPQGFPDKAPPQAVSGQAEISQFQRTHINLARAEALLNRTNPTQTKSHAPIAPPRLATPQAAEPSAPSDAWMHESSFDRLGRTQRKLADAAAQLTPSAETPAINARQLLVNAEPTIPPAPNTRPAQVFSSVFQCSHCGTEHQIESQLQLNITSRPAGERVAS